MNIITQILGAFTASFGFAIIFRARKHRLMLCGLSGALGWVICILADFYIGNTFTTYFFGAAFVTLFSEILARVTKTPASVYLLPGIIPMVPGGSLYYTTYSLVTGDKAAASHHAGTTLYAALGIAFGLVVVSVIMYYYNESKLKKAGF